MNNINKYLVNRHIPVVVNAIKRLENEPSEESKPYLIKFDAQSEDAQKGTIAAIMGYNPVVYYTLPQEYATLFTASKTDPNRYMTMRITVTSVSGENEFSATLNMNKSLTDTTSQYSKSLYPDRNHIDDFNSSEDLLTNFSNLETTYGNEISTKPLENLERFATPLITTLDNAGTLGIYFYGLAYWVSQMGSAIFGEGNPTPGINSADMKNFLGSNVSLDSFIVTAIYTPSRLP